MDPALEYLAMTIEPSGQLSEYEETFENLLPGKEDFHIFRYVLAMAANVDDSDLLKDETAFIGGFSLVPHIAKQIQDVDLKRWRGSHDVDVVSKNEYHLTELLNNFQVLDIKKSLSFPHKKIVKLENDYDPKEPVIIDYFHNPHDPNKVQTVAGYAIDKSFWNAIESLPVFGIPIRVPSLDNFINMKLRVKTQRTNLPRERDIQDLLHSIALKEIEDGSVEEAYSAFSLSQLETLSKIGTIYRDHSSSAFIRDLLVIPTKTYLHNIDEFYEEKRSMADSQGELSL